MNTRTLAITAAVFTFLCGTAVRLAAQDADDAPAITARVHGTFTDKAGGAGVLSGDMFIVRFELRNGTVTAIGRIKGSLADSIGDLLGLVDDELALPVGEIDATCNQLRMDLAATDAEVLATRLHFDRETGGFDSRDGATPKALGVLCAAADGLRGTPTAAARVRLLNDVAQAIARRR
jgi:hypothetical protein